ncbi:probable RNA-binding protein CG14230 [Amphibalanus amphitrite]|uniref:probable RNA-binding protein CG14230 n=1 Tax=Amphibalanus amphitrite TaxID=1232801 RepID=UPI001C90AFE3|nr:probable RNA-binding protein CG14230 [Amphibalanus amphitrite]XP_043194912.1 probable RNA-binding protein CG14230 [Amphibalanus amphitrite]XP_043194913.1 probable RNA-binding protein CG14230 [Amphibalanus amphitrite]
MESKRVYVGGLYHEATDKDLRQLFSKFGDVDSVEIKKRSENNVVNFVFAYVNVKTTDPQITQCFRRLNGTFWKGKRLKLELAKESFLAKLQREREQNRPAGRPPPPPPPPRRRTMQDRILDDVLASKKRRSEDVASGGVVDFTEEAPSSAPAPVQNGHHESPEPKRKKKKKSREVSPPPVPVGVEAGGDGDEPPPTRGALRMFGGIGGARTLTPTAPVSESAVPASTVSPSPAPSSSSPATAPASHTPVSGDFLSRLEAFSSVWGDDGDGTPREPFVPARRAATTPVVAAAPATVTATPVSTAKATPKASANVPATSTAKAAATASPTAPAPAPVVRRGQTAVDDNERRMASLRQKQEAFQSQKRALQLALSAKADIPRPNKRIVFDASDDEDAEPERESSGGVGRTPGRGPSLFGEDEDEEEEQEDADDFRVRPQYEGAKGQKLQALQARFGADDRFTLDERFAEEDQQSPEDRGEEEEERGEEVREEHRQQMNILDSVLGTAAEPERKGKLAKKKNSDSGPVRFDPSLESHAQYQLDAKKQKQKKKSLDADRTPTPATTPAAAPAPAVESGTFYQVAPQLGDLFSRGGSTGGGGGFSLLKMMGRAADDDEDEKEDEYKTSEIKEKKKRHSIEGAAANPFRYDSSSSEDEAEDGSTVQSLGVAAGGGWTQARKFFLQKDDPRLEEGLEWVRSAPSVDELRERAEQQRPELVELFRTMRHSRQRAQRRGRGRGRRMAGR